MFGTYTRQEAAVLRELARQTMEIAQSDRNQRNRELWRQVNDLESTRPVATAYALPWNELNVNDELTLRCENPYLREIETELRRQLYQHQHMPMDMVVEPFIRSKVFYTDSGYGVEVSQDTKKTDAASRVESHHFNAQIACMEDIAKIRNPVIAYEKEKTERALEINHDIFDGIMDVRRYCYLGPFWSSWDNLIQLTGVQELFYYLYDEPEFLLALTRRYIEASMAKFRQIEALGILTQNDDNVLGIANAGTGGYRYTKRIPHVPEGQVRLKDIWGCSAAQIFTNISPEMFDRFAIDCELPWLDQFAMTYYGCCEKLSDKMDSMRRVKNLRKLTVSAWEDPEAAAEQIGRDYVYSFKPAVSVLAYDQMNEDELRTHLAAYLGAAARHGCNTEVILKTVSTVMYDPRRLWRFAEIITEEIEKVCG